MQKSLRRFALFPLAWAAVLWIAPVAHANTFYFSYIAPGGVSGTGILDGTFEGVIDGNQEWLITSGSGVFHDGVNNGAIALVPNLNGPDNSSLSPSGQITYDDLLFPSAGPGQYLDSDGLLFSFGGLELNLYDFHFPVFFGDSWFEDNGNGGYGTLAVAATPEPDSWLLLGAGLLALMLARLWNLSRPSASLPN
ncbi:MAG: PEP-CTERM sorting domain-containing protein [Terracidiphilus sp.]